MRTVNIAELKNKLSAYLTFAKAGETVIIRDRNRPVAKLVPLVAEGLSWHELMLVATGQTRLADRRRDIERILKMPRPKIEGYSGLQAILDETGRGWTIVLDSASLLWTTPRRPAAT